MESNPQSKGTKSLARALDAEFTRVSKHEDIPMGDLVEQVALMAETSTRSLYNYRSGKWPLPSHLIPILCKRFRSLALFDVLKNELKDAPIDLPINSEAAWDVARTIIGDTCQVYEQVKQALDHDTEADYSRLDFIEQRSDQIARDCRLLYATAQRAMEAKSELRRRRA